jgi:hypothetical protein
MRRLVRLLSIERPTPLYAMSPGELAAMSWLAETATQQRLCERMGDRVLKFDFDRLLLDVGGSMGRICAHFGLPRDERFLSAVGGSTALARYSKAPEHTYSPELRSQILAEARRTHGEEIRNGLAWLQSVARANAGAAAVLQANG